MDSLMASLRAWLTAAGRSEVFILAVTSWFVFWGLLAWLTRRRPVFSRPPILEDATEREAKAWSIVDDVKRRSTELSTIAGFDADKLFDRTRELVERIATYYEPGKENAAFHISPQQAFEHVKITMALVEEQVLPRIPRTALRKVSIEDYKKCAELLSPHTEKFEAGGHLAGRLWNLYRLIVYGPPALVFSLLARAVISGSMQAFVEGWLESAGAIAISLYSGRPLLPRSTNLARSTLSVMIEAAWVDGPPTNTERKLIIDRVLDDPDLYHEHRTALLRELEGKATVQGMAIAEVYSLAEAISLLQEVERVLLLDPLNPTKKADFHSAVRRWLARRYPEIDKLDKAERNLRAQTNAHADPPAPDALAATPWDEAIDRIRFRAWCIAAAEADGALSDLTAQTIRALQIDELRARRWFAEEQAAGGVGRSDIASLLSREIREAASPGLRHALRAVADVLVMIKPLRCGSVTFLQKVAEGMGQSKMFRPVLDEALQAELGRIGVNGNRAVPGTLIQEVFRDLTSGEGILVLERLDVVSWNGIPPEKGQLWVCTHPARVSLYWIPRAGNVVKRWPIHITRVQVERRRLRSDHLHIDTKDVGNLTVTATKALVHALQPHSAVASA